MDVSTQLTNKQKYQLIYALSSAAFLVFFQAYMVAPINPKRAGQAMGLNVFLLFVGFGLGSYIFGEFIRFGLLKSFLEFGIFKLVIGILAIYLF